MRSLLLAALAGCGRLGFDVLDDVGAITDATTPCTFGAWSTPQKLPGPIQTPDAN